MCLVIEIRLSISHYKKKKIQYLIMQLSVTFPEY